MKAAEVHLAELETAIIQQGGGAVSLYGSFLPVYETWTPGT
jgi:hypothetical protein